jgi:lysophospholipase L1-like esterase
LSPAVRTVVCYGDSNTWGYDASTGGRLDRSKRWPGVVQQELGDDVQVVEAGLNSRTTMYELDGYASSRSGLAVLPLVLETHAPVDVLVSFLGANDLFVRNVRAEDVAAGARAIVDSAVATSWGRDGGSPSIVIVVPPPFGPLRSDWAAECPRCVAESHRLGGAFAAALRGSAGTLLELDGVATPTALDGIHFDPDQHERIGRAVADRVRNL